MALQETAAHKQTPAVPEKGGTRSPQSLREPIGSQRVALVAIGIPSLGLYRPVKETQTPWHHGFRGLTRGRKLHPTNRKGKLIGQSPRRGDQSERRAAPSLSNVAPAFQNRTLPGRQGRGGRRGRCAPCVPRVRRRIPARQPLRTGPPLRLGAGGGGSAAEGSRPALPMGGGLPGAGVGAPKEEEREGGCWKVSPDFPHLPNCASFRLGT